MQNLPFFSEGGGVMALPDLSLRELLQDFILNDQTYRESELGSKKEEFCRSALEGIADELSRRIHQLAQPVQWLKIDENTIISVDGRSEVFWEADPQRGELSITLCNFEDCGHVVPPRHAQRVWEYYCGLALDLTQTDVPLTQAMTEPLDSCPRCGSILIESVGSGLRCEVCLSTVSDGEVKS